MICTDTKLAAPTPNFFRIGRISHEVSVNRQSVRFSGEEEGVPQTEAPVPRVQARAYARNKTIRVKEFRHPKGRKTDTVARTLTFRGPARARCRQELVSERASAGRSRCRSNARRPGMAAGVRTRSRAFCIGRERRFPRSTAWDVAGSRWSSRTFRAFSRSGEYRGSRRFPRRRKRRTRRRNRVRLDRAVAVRQRRANQRSTSSRIARRARRPGRPRRTLAKGVRGVGVKPCRTTRGRCSNRSAPRGGSRRARECRRRANGVDRGRPRGHFGACAAQSLRRRATACQTALVRSWRRGNAQPGWGTSWNTNALGWGYRGEPSVVIPAPV
jgi:hypothetical protein